MNSRTFNEVWRYFVVLFSAYSNSIKFELLTNSCERNVNEVHTWHHASNNVTFAAKWMVAVSVKFIIYETRFNSVLSKDRFGPIRASRLVNFDSYSYTEPIVENKNNAKLLIIIC